MYGIDTRERDRKHENNGHEKRTLLRKELRESNEFAHVRFLDMSKLQILLVVLKIARREKSPHENQHTEKNKIDQDCKML
jgi:hypothetical protein